MLVSLLLPRFIMTYPATVNEGAQELLGEALVLFMTTLLLGQNHLRVFDIYLLLPMLGKQFIEELALFHKLEDLLKTVGCIGE